MKFKFLKMVLTTCRYTIFLSVGALTITGNASATLIDSIAALDDGDKYRVLFVTNTGSYAASSDISFYNNFVSAEAAGGTITGGLGLSWTTLASTAAVNVKDNTGLIDMNQQITFFNTLGEVIAGVTNDLFSGNHGSVSTAYTQDGFFKSTNIFTGTNSNADTTWEPLGHTPYITDAHSTYDNSNWINAGHNDGRTHAYSLYAISGEATVNTEVVTEPSILAIFSLGLFGIGFARRRRS
jgi:hypothetical protein